MKDRRCSSQETTLRKPTSLEVLICITILLVIAESACSIKPTPHAATTATPSDHSPTSTQKVVVATSVNVQTTRAAPASPNWMTFSDASLHYAIKYPSDWFAQDLKDTTNRDQTDSLLISDRAGNSSPQTRTSDETARIFIASFKRSPDQPLQAWVLQNWSWINGPLDSFETGGFSAVRAQFISNDAPDDTQLMIWIERPNTTLLLWCQVKTAAPRSLNTVKDILTTLSVSQ